MLSLAGHRRELLGYYPLDLGGVVELADDTLQDIMPQLEPVAGHDTALRHVS